MSGKPDDTERYCERCGQPLTRNKNMSQPRFTKVRFCSNKCRALTIRPGTPRDKEDHDEG